MEPLGGRCVASATPADLPDVELESLVIVTAASEVRLLTVPAWFADGRTATVRWGDGVVTDARLEPEGNEVAVWGDRAPGTGDVVVRFSASPGGAPGVEFRVRVTAPSANAAFSVSLDAARHLGWSLQVSLPVPIAPPAQATPPSDSPAGRTPPASHAEPSVATLLRQLGESPRPTPQAPNIPTNTPPPTPPEAPAADVVLASAPVAAEAAPDAEGGPPARASAVRVEPPAAEPKPPARPTSRPTPPRELVAVGAVALAAPAVAFAPAVSVAAEREVTDAAPVVARTAPTEAAANAAPAAGPPPAPPPAELLEVESVDAEPARPAARAARDVVRDWADAAPPPATYLPPAAAPPADAERDPRRRPTGVLAFAAAAWLAHSLGRRSGGGRAFPRRPGGVG